MHNHVYGDGEEGGCSFVGVSRTGILERHGEGGCVEPGRRGGVDEEVIFSASSGSVSGLFVQLAFVQYKQKHSEGGALIGACLLFVNVSNLDFWMCR